MKQGYLEACALAACVALALGLGFANLGGPSLWHDELVHVFVAKSVAAGEGALLPSSVFYPNAWGYAHVLGAFIALFGDSEFVVRAPSVLFSGINVVLLYLLARLWFGWRVALVAAFLLATSPWHVAWARQARMYELQATCYLVMLFAVWRYCMQPDLGRFRFDTGWALLALGAYVLGMLCSFHSILFLGAPLLFAACLLLPGLVQRQPITRLLASRPGRVLIAGTVLGGITALALYLNPNPVDQQAVFHGLGTELIDPARNQRDYYLRWLGENLGAGCLLIAIVGGMALAWRRDRAALFAVLAFVVPLVVLTFFIGYRRPRFLFFAYPFYAVLLAYGIAFIALHLRAAHAHPWRWPAAIVAAALLLRVGYTLLLLLGDSVELARGARNTLASSHPEWRPAGKWVRQHRQDHAVLTTTYLAALYYVGEVDDWFPSRYLPGEVQESGKPGLAGLDELKAFVAAHPRGYFLSERGRFENWAQHGVIGPEVSAALAWVEGNMRPVPEASTIDVQVYEWGY